MRRKRTTTQNEDVHEFWQGSHLDSSLKYRAALLKRTGDSSSAIYSGSQTSILATVRSVQKPNWIVIRKRQDFVLQWLQARAATCEAKRHYAPHHSHNIQERKLKKVLMD